MKIVWILLLSSGLSVSSHFLMRGLRSDTARGAERTGHAANAGRQELARLRDQLAQVERETKRARKGVALVKDGAPSSTAFDNATTTEEIEAAFERYLAAHASTSTLDAPPTPDAMEAIPIPDIATMPIQDILKLFRIEQFGQTGAERLFQALRDNGRMDEYVEALQAEVDKDPSNPELRTALGIAYLQKLFGATPGPDSGVLAMEADMSFDKALELDSTNWRARYMKAVSLSNWPAFLGKTGEAIANFETLITQQETVDSRPEFAQTYLFLGNMYQQIGEPEKALAVWRQGHDLFPLSAELQTQLGLLEQD